MYSKKKTVRSLILVAAILIVLVILLVSLGDIKSIGQVLATTNYLYILVCIGLLLVYCLGFQISLTLLIKNKYQGISFYQSMLVGGTEFFFNGITPFSSGGQPFQAYALKRKDMKLSDSTSVLLINFLSYQIVMNLFSIVALILYYTKLHEQINNLIWLLIVGFSINILMMAFIVMIGATKFTGKLFIKIMRGLCKIKFLRKLETKIPEFENYVAEMQNAFLEMRNHLGLVSIVMLLKAISLAAYYTIPFFIFYAIGVNISYKEIFYVISMTSFALTICVWLPTPGASGGAELAFTTLFAGLLVAYDNAQSIAMSGMLIWRLLTYYLLMLYGLINYLAFERRNSNENRSIQ